MQVIGEYLACFGYYNSGIVACYGGFLSIRNKASGRLLIH